MINVFNALGANGFGPASCNVMAGSTGEVSKIMVEVRGTFTGSVFVHGRLIGQGKARGLAATAAADFVAKLSLINTLTGAIIAGSTGITAVGLYLVDISGLEVALEFAFGSGAVTVDVHPVLG